MIISGGFLRSRRFEAPRGMQTRPTPGRVKEALFSILGERLVGKPILDLYAGTGALGFEAISRGASSAVFVESHRKTADAITANIAKFGIADRCAVIIGSVERAIFRVGKHAAFAFADPPFAEETPLPIFAELFAQHALADDGIVIYEHAASRSHFDPGKLLRIIRQEHWGEVGMTFLASGLRGV